MTISFIVLKLSKNQARLTLQQQIGRIARLPKVKQRFVMEMLETVVPQASR